MNYLNNVSDKNLKRGGGVDYIHDLEKKPSKNWNRKNSRTYDISQIQHLLWKLNLLNKNTPKKIVKATYIPEFWRKIISCLVKKKT